MSAELEHALLVLNAAVFAGQVDPEQVGVPDLDDLLEGDGPRAALEQAALEAADAAAANDRFAVAQAFVLGVRHQAVNGGVGAQLQGLAEALLTPLEVEAPVDAAAARLIDSVTQLASDAAVTPLLIHEFASAFGNALVVEGVAPAPITFRERAASTATMLYEMATNGGGCRARFERINVDGKLKEVTLVEVDVCTSLPFDRCKKGIDPRRWPDCNPYFKKVTMIGPEIPSPSGDGWAGTIEEEVGPAMNGKTYTTDLDVRYVAQPRLAALAFDLVSGWTGSVSVDRGFLSVTDEGIRRRMRVLKVYRIENLATPPLFVCPLWAWQVVWAGWWCP